MQSVVDLYSSVYLTAIGMDTRSRCEDPFDELDGERPKGKSLLTRIKSQFIPVIFRRPRQDLKPDQELLTERELRI